MGLAKTAGEAANRAKAAFVKVCIAKKKKREKNYGRREPEEEKMEKGSTTTREREEGKGREAIGRRWSDDLLNKNIMKTAMRRCLYRSRNTDIQELG